MESRTKTTKKSRGKGLFERINNFEARIGETYESELQEESDQLVASSTNTLIEEFLEQKTDYQQLLGERFVQQKTDYQQLLGEHMTVSHAATLFYHSLLIGSFVQSKTICDAMKAGSRRAGIRLLVRLRFEIQYPSRSSKWYPWNLLP